MAKLRIATPKPKRIPQDPDEIALAYQAAEQESLEDAAKLRARRWQFRGWRYRASQLRSWRSRRAEAKTNNADS